jgi:hypothetical protein
MSQTFASVIVMLLAQLLPLIGVEIANEQLTGFVSTAVTIGAAPWIWVRGVYTRLADWAREHSAARDTKG